MGAEIDRLDVQVEAEAKDANKQLDDLAAKIGLVAKALSSISNMSGFKEVTSKSKQVAESMSEISTQAKSVSQAVSKSMGNSSKPMQQVAKTASEIAEKYKDLGKDFQFFGSTSSAEKQIEKYSNALETAKLKKAELEATGKTEGQMYEYAIRDIQKYSNMIDSLKGKLNDPVKFDGDLSSMNEQELDNWFNNLPSIKAQAEQAAQSIKESFEQIEEPIRESFALASEPLKELDLTLANFSTKATQAFVEPKVQSQRFSDSLEELKDVARGIQERFLELKGRMENTLVSKGLKTYTSEHVELQNQITKTEKTLATLNAQLARSRETVKNFEGTTSYRKMQYDIAKAREELTRLRNEQDKLETSGGATKWNFSELSSSTKNLQKSLQPLYSTLKKVSDVTSKFAKRVLSIILPLKNLKKSTDKFHGSLSGGFKTILKYGIGIESIRVLFNKLRSAMADGMKNLVQYSDETNASVSLLMNSMNQLKNASAAAIAPLLNVIAPALNKIIQLFVNASNAVNQFFSALLGKGTWIRAKKLTDDYAASISDAAKTAKGALQPFDALNNLTTQDKSGAGTDPSDMFETVPIESKFKDLADKVKDVLSKLFAPLKEAWDREGKFVLDSWKYALDEVWKLIKDIGRDFLAVWQQEETVKIFENLLHIIGDIGLIVGNLARNFREAWNENQTGLHILENIRDIIGIIVQHIRNAADATVEWADKLDFYPLLEAFNRFLESLEPVVDSLSGVLEDFYTMVLLPLGKWVLEKGLPELLQVFIDFNNKVDWESLRTNLAEFWKHLEPFAETVGEGLIIFIDRVSDALADFLNSQEFKDFLVTVENWMDSVSPEDVANGLEKIAKGLGALAIASTVFSGISSALSPLENLALVFALFKGGSAAGASEAIGAVGTTAGASVAPILAVVAAVTALVAGLGYVFATNEEVRQSFENAITSIREGLQPALQFLTETLLPNLKAGWDRILEVLSPMGEFLSGMFTSIWQDMINPALTYIGQTVLPKVTGAFENLWNNVLVPLGNFLASVLEPVIKIVSDLLSILWQNVVVPLADAVGNVLGKAFEGLVEIFNTVVVPILNRVIEVLQFLWDNVLSPLVDYLKTTLQPVFETVFKAIGGIIEGLGQTLGGLIDFITGVFSGNWEKAWNGVKDIFKGIFNGIVSIAEGVLNLIIDGLNFFLGKFDGVVNDIGDVIGIDISIPKIPKVELPRLATGGLVYKPTIAEIGEAGKEGIIPLTNSAAMHTLANEIIDSAGMSNYSYGGNGYLDQVEEATYRGMIRAMQSMGGFGEPTVNVTLEERTGQIFKVVREDYKEQAKRRGITTLDPVLG